MWSVIQTEDGPKLAFAGEIMEVDKLSHPTAREALNFMLKEISKLEANLENLGNLLGEKHE